MSSNSSNIIASSPLHHELSSCHIAYIITPTHTPSPCCFRCPTSSNARCHRVLHNGTAHRLNGKHRDFYLNHNNIHTALRVCARVWLILTTFPIPPSQSFKWDHFHASQCLHSAYPPCLLLSPLLLFLALFLNSPFSIPSSHLFSCNFIAFSHYIMFSLVMFLFSPQLPPVIRLAKPLSLDAPMSESQALGALKVKERRDVIRYGWTQCDERQNVK